MHKSLVTRNSEERCTYLHVTREERLLCFNFSEFFFHFHKKISQFDNFLISLLQHQVLVCRVWLDSVRCIWQLWRRRVAFSRLSNTRYELPQHRPQPPAIQHSTSLRCVFHNSWRFYFPRVHDMLKMHLVYLVYAIRTFPKHRRKVSSAAFAARHALVCRNPLPTARTASAACTQHCSHRLSGWRHY